MRERMITQLPVGCGTAIRAVSRMSGRLVALALLAGLLSSCVGPPSGELVRVQRPDGSRQCREGGASPAAMGARLEDAGIEVYCREKARDGRPRVAMCGAASGRINVYSISAGDLARARELGFEPLPETADGLERCVDVGD